VGFDFGAGINADDLPVSAVDEVAVRSAQRHW
jgi:hypothetical protein